VCDEVLVYESGRTTDCTVVDTVGDLRRFMPTLVADKAYCVVLGDAACLCCVDIPATCSANGYRYVLGEEGVYHAHKQTEAAR
jgi:hypothetical protein